MYSQVFGVSDQDKDPSTGDVNSLIYSTTAKWSNVSGSSFAYPEEDVEEVRRNAPEWFKTGNRLVTASDFEYYVRNRFKDNIIDVKC